MDQQAVQEIWRTADCVCFDVDSTVCVDEAIDELAAFIGAGEKVAELTAQAMAGSMTYQQSLAARLHIMQPSQQQVSEFMSANPPRLSPDMKGLACALQKRHIPIYLISGGFTSIIEAVARELDIPACNIYANKLMFYHDGSYAGFDENQPTSKTGGKPKVIQGLKAKQDYTRVVHIGDGATDMEACPPADAFIGYGGNVVRESVKQGAKWFIMDLKELIDALD